MQTSTPPDLLNVAIVRLCRTNVSEMILAKLHNLQLSHTEFRNYQPLIFAFFCLHNPLYICCKLLRHFLRLRYSDMSRSSCPIPLIKKMMNPAGGYPPAHIIYRPVPCRVMNEYGCSKDYPELPDIAA